MEKRFKVLLLNGSPRENGNIALAFKNMEQVFDELNVEYEDIQLGKKDIRGCIACEKCRETGKCVFNDIVNELAEKLKESDGLVIGSPVYYGSANGTLMSALQRLFYSNHSDLSLKVGASVVSARRSGCTATFDELNKFFTLSNMPVATSQYWNNIYGWVREVLTMRASRSCVCLQEIWSSSWRVLRSARNRLVFPKQKNASGLISQGK